MDDLNSRPWQEKNEISHPFDDEEGTPLDTTTTTNISLVVINLLYDSSTKPYINLVHFWKTILEVQ